MKLIAAKKKGKTISADEKADALKKIKELTLTLKSTQAGIKAAERHVAKAQSAVKMRKVVHERNVEMLDTALKAAASVPELAAKKLPETKPLQSRAAAKPEADVDEPLDADQSALDLDFGDEAAGVDDGEFEIDLDFD